MYFYPGVNQQQNYPSFQHSSDYYQNGSNFNYLYQQIQNSNKFIEELKQQNSKLRQQLSKMQQSQMRIEESPIIEAKKPNKYYKKIRNQNGEIMQKNYQCPFDDCLKIYGSNLALDLHIKKKHDGGTRKQRQAYAKMIIMAQIKGEPVPHINFNFPPDYVQKYRKNLIKKKNYEESQQKSAE